MEYSLRNMTPEQREDLRADIETLVQERHTYDKVTVQDIDTLCRINGLDLDYSFAIIRLVRSAFAKRTQQMHPRPLSKPVDEASIISKTGSDGETSFEAVPDDMARQLNGITTTDIKGNKTTVKDTGKKTLGEAEDFGKTTLNQQDVLNLAKDLDVCTKEALRATGNGVAYTQQFFNKGKATITIKVFFQENADNPGKPESQEFKYILAKGKVVLDKGKGAVTNISAIQTQSGTANINRDLAINSIKNSISKEENVATGEAGTSEPNSDIKDKPMLENFSKAVEAYRKNKSKETIKELFRSAREFPGDDIQHKFRNAVQLYKGQGCQNLDPEKCCSGGQCMSDCEIKLSESLFIRLLEFAKEDAKDDVDLHTVAENLSRICSEGRCASIEDYSSIVGDSEQDNPGEGIPEEETEQPEQLQEVDERFKNIKTDNTIPDIDPDKTYTYTYYHFNATGKDGLSGHGALTGKDLIEWLKALDQDRNFKCQLNGSRAFVWVTGKKGQLQESEPDEQDWDNPFEVGSSDGPGEVIFYYDPETKGIWDEDKFRPEPGRTYITGTIDCAETDLEDLSFSHAFGTEYIYEPKCTEVDIRIDGMEKDGDCYDADEDIAEAENLLSKEDWENIRKWGIELMTNKM